MADKLIIVEVSGAEGWPWGYSASFETFEAAQKYAEGVVMADGVCSEIKRARVVHVKRFQIYTGRRGTEPRQFGDYFDTLEEARAAVRQAMKSEPGIYCAGVVDNVTAETVYSEYKSS